MKEGIMREEEIKEIIKEETEERIQEIKELLKSQYEKNNERYILNFKEVVKKGLCEAEKRRKENKKGEIKYIYVNCLRTSIETKEYEYLIRIMDEEQYTDTEVVEVTYVPEYIPELIKKDEEYFEKLIMKKVIRAKKYEVKDFLREYIWKIYIKPIPEEIKYVLSNMNELEEFNIVEHSEKIRVSYGELFERMEYNWKY